MKVFHNRRGMMLIPFALILLVVAVFAGALLFQMNISQKKFTDTVESAEDALYLAEEGLALAYAEMREQGSDWFTHEIGVDGESLVRLPGPHNPKIKGAMIDENGDYLPLGDDRVRVRVYKDENDTIWAVSLAQVNGIVRVVRASMVYGSLLEFFHFYNRGHTFGNITFDGKGIGSIYVNGDIRFAGHTRFVNVPMLSTNSAGRIYVVTDNKYPPYEGDYWLYNAQANGLSKNDAQLDGLGYFPMINDEFYRGYRSGGYYYSHVSGESSLRPGNGTDRWQRWWPSSLIGRGAKRAWGYADFHFDQSVMGDKLDLGGNSSVTVRTPVLIFGSSKSDPINYKFDIYKDKDHDEVGAGEGEKPVRYVRLFRKARNEDGSVKIDKQGNIVWEFTSNPANAEVAEVFDGKQTTDDTITMKYIDETGNIKTATIPVDESTKYVIYNEPVYEYDPGLKKKVIVDYIPHEVTYNVAKEQKLWASMFRKRHYSDIPEKLRNYIENGYYRGDAEFPEFGYPEYDGFNALNTGFGPHAQRFKDWIEGKYTPDDIDFEHGRNGIVDLTGVIKEGSTGAVTLEPVELRTTLPYQAKEDGIWVGYERGDDRRQHFRIYIRGHMVYDKDSRNMNELPDWLSKDNFITGNATNGERRVTAYTIDLEELKNDIPNIDDAINGVIWIDVKPPGEDNWYDTAVRIVNGEEIPREGGLTIATPQSVMIQGDLNYQYGEEEQQYEPVAIVTDGDVYVLSKDFKAPEYVPAYGEPVKPYRGWNRYLSDYVKSKLGLPRNTSYWPDPNKDSEELYNKKLEAIRDAVKEFYTAKISERDRKYGAPDEGLLENYLDKQFDPSKERVEDLESKINYYFKVSRNPLTATKVPVDLDGDGKIEPDEYEWQTDYGLVPAMVAVKDDADNRQVVINAAIVSGEYRGDTIRYIENWSWFGGDDEYSNPASVRIEGMFPHVVSKQYRDWNRWSYDYNKTVFSGSINANPPLTYAAHDYSNGLPPGDLSYVGLSAYFVEKDPTMYNKHPY